MGGGGMNDLFSWVRKFRGAWLQDVRRALTAFLWWLVSCESPERHWFFCSKIKTFYVVIGGDWGTKGFVAHSNLVPAEGSASFLWDDPEQGSGEVFFIWKCKAEKTSFATENWKTQKSFILVLPTVRRIVWSQMNEFLMMPMLKTY